MKRKLNNHGWGFSTFIAFIGVFILAIILITIGAVKMGIGSKNSLPLDVPVTTTSPTPTNPPVSSGDDYQDQIEEYEEQIKEVAAMVVEDYKENWDGQQLVYTVSDFIQANYLNKLEINANLCSGYVVVSQVDSKPDYQVYLYCGNLYTTDGYQADLDKEIE
ncbi:MAG TPA: hypothetical protein IAB56_07320 [Candidatus Scybalousia intestinigallinarum]|nr:hypothetical protein [Candidatus Scybalousia intestinigallinarum]